VWYDSGISGRKAEDIRSASKTAVLLERRLPDIALVHGVREGGIAQAVELPSLV